MYTYIQYVCNERELSVRRETLPQTSQDVVVPGPSCFYFRHLTQNHKKNTQTHLSFPEWMINWQFRSDLEQAKQIRPVLTETINNHTDRESTAYQCGRLTLGNRSESVLLNRMCRSLALRSYWIGGYQKSARWLKWTLMAAWRINSTPLTCTSRGGERRVNRADVLRSRASGHECDSLPGCREKLKLLHPYTHTNTH